MSHTIGQVTEDNQHSSNLSQVDRDLSVPEDKTFEPISLLSDADYEFLFNQLLEGITHGWHEPRIAKFFHQLEDRGKSQDWVAWLERLRVKMLTLPVQSKQQLGTVMIRLGELTQSTPDIKKIGSVSHRIGKELLFGNTEDVIWEYVGPDLIPDSLTVEVEENLSTRLPTDFDELGTAAIASTDTDSISTPQLESSAEIADQISTESTSETFTTSDSNPEQLTESGKNSFETEQIDKAIDDLFFAPVSPQTSVPIADESTPILSSSSDNQFAKNEIEFEEISRQSQKFEFESDNPQPELESSDSAENNDVDLISKPKTEPKTNFALDNSQQQPNTDKSIIINTDTDPVAIDIEQVMNLIQEDEALAQEISQKLNSSQPKSKPNDLTTANLEPSLEHFAKAPAAELDNSSIELIEGWFNLGLKQVSAQEFDKAIVSWEKALKINPNLSEAWHNRGSALGRLGEYKQAVASFDKALTIDPANYQAWNDRAHALYQMQKWSEASVSWGNALKLTPGNYLFWYNRGCALEQLEKWTESIASYGKSLEIKPDFQPARLRYTNLIADNSHAN